MIGTEEFKICCRAIFPDCVFAEVEDYLWMYNKKAITRDGYIDTNKWEYSCYMMKNLYGENFIVTDTDSFLVDEMVEIYDEKELFEFLEDVKRKYDGKYKS